LLNVFGLTPGGSSTVHIYTQYIEQHKQYIEQHVTGKSAGRSLSLRVLPRHWPGNWGRSMEKKLNHYEIFDAAI